MGIFDKVVKRLADRAADEMIENMREESQPYFYLSILPFGGPDQDLPPGVTALPDGVLEYAHDNGGMIAFSSDLEPPERSEYLNGVLCTFHARSRMEAAGAILAFGTLTDERLELAIMQSAVNEIANLDFERKGAESDERASQIFEFTKSPDGDLMVAFPTQTDEGVLDFSGCFITLTAPRRTDSEVARMVVQASASIHHGNLLPSLMCSLHRDIDSYGTLHSGFDPQSGIEGG